MSISIEKGPTGRIRGLRRLLAGMSKADVLNAIEKFSIEEAERYGFAESTDFDLVYEGRRFPPKAILGLAAEREIGRPLDPAEFSGGEASACFAVLRSLGRVCRILCKRTIHCRRKPACPQTS
jgi:hypothetical protein